MHTFHMRNVRRNVTLQGLFVMSRLCFIDLLEKELCEGKHDAGVRTVVSNFYVLGKTYNLAGKEGDIICFTLKYNQTYFLTTAKCLLQISQQCHLLVSTYVVCQRPL